MTNVNVFFERENDNLWRVNFNNGSENFIEAFGFIETNSHGDLTNIVIDSNHSKDENAFIYYLVKYEFYNRI